MGAFNEAGYEQSVIELFEHMGWEHLYGPDIERDYRIPYYSDSFERALSRINPSLPQDAIHEAQRKISEPGTGSLEQKNKFVTDFLQNGVPVSYVKKGEEISTLAYLIDYAHPENNSFQIINQWTYVEKSEKRADIILFVNGLPLVLVELKSPSRENTDASDAYLQLRNYMHEIPSLFTYVQICVMSDQLTSKAGTITCSEDRFMEWKTKDGNKENTQAAQFDTFFEGMFQKERLPDIIKNFTCFDEGEKQLSKILAGYHQYFAVRKAVVSTVKATKTDGKAGVFWHSTGSGKSLSMVFYAHLLQTALNEPTIVVVTDRNDLDNQLFSQFAHCSAFLRQTPVQAESRENLRELLEGRQANGIFFTTMQKFEESDTPLSTRRNIVVMADEAHRGQYGLDEKIRTIQKADGSLEARVVTGTARIIRDSLPNASYIGFTGTPVSSTDRNTREVFGDYIDIYDMTQSVEDGATRPVYYESRVVKLNLDPEVLKQIDNEYDVLAQNADEQTIEQSKQELSHMESLLGSDSTIDSLVNDILYHYEHYRASELTGKAMIVAQSRPIAMKLYRNILSKRPTWTEKIAVVMTSSNKDPEDWHDVIGNKAHRDELARRFKDNDDPLKIAVVVDMWLTGFDVPSLATMYIYKPMEGYNLIQAVSRVNRVFKNKEGGLIVDYVGIAGALRRAMNEYTGRDKKNYGDTDIGKTAYPKFLEKLEVCRNLFYGFDYTGIFSDSQLALNKTISDGLNFMLDISRTDKRDLFLKEALMMTQAESLAKSLIRKEEQHEAAFFDAVRTLIVRITYAGNGRKFSLKEINEQINNLLKASIQSTGVINLFADKDSDFNLFDSAFLEEVSRMKEKNVAVELLKRLIADQVKIYRRTNIVQSQKFSERMQKTLNSYLNGLLTNEQVIEEMMQLAKEMAAASQEGNKLGLSHEELAFYDALTKPAAIRDFYSNDELIAITRELTEQLRKNRTIDWQKKETARARMRLMIKKLLKAHKYPPDEIPGATETVIEQCELWTDNTDMTDRTADTDAVYEIPHNTDLLAASPKPVY